MFQELVTLTVFVAIANAGIVIGGIDHHDGGYGGGHGGDYGGEYGGGIVGGHGYVVDLHAPAKYEFQYGVQDHKTGDQKQQSEVRVGDVVKGEYSLTEADGTIRVVKYTADDKNGFNAVVSRVGHAAHPTVLIKKAVVPVAHAVPVATHGIAIGDYGGVGGGYGSVNGPVAHAVPVATHGIAIGDYGGVGGGYGSVNGGYGGIYEKYVGADDGGYGAIGDHLGGIKESYKGYYGGIKVVSGDHNKAVY